MSDDAMLPAPVLRFEEAAEQTPADRDAERRDVEEIPIATLQRSNCSRVVVSLVRSKHGARGLLISVCVWFRNAERPDWFPDKRRRGAILMPSEVPRVIAALERAREAAQDIGWKPASWKATRSDGDAHAE
jgi:hypothetical protein